MTDVRTAFERVLADEPPLTLGLAPVVTAGRRIRRRNRLRYAATGVAASLAVTAGAVAVVTRDEPVDRLTSRYDVEPFSPLAPALPAPAAELTPAQRAIADAIVAASPAGWTFELGADRWDGTSSVEATADDGAGPGRLLVGVNPVGGTPQLRPCGDDEFRQGASCTERTLPDGSVLSLRGRVDSRGLSYVLAVVTHPDGSGVLAESGSYTVTWPLPSTIQPEDKDDLMKPSRPDPTYTTEELARVVTAVYEAVRRNAGG